MNQNLHIGNILNKNSHLKQLAISSSVIDHLEPIIINKSLPRIEINDIQFIQTLTIDLTFGKYQR